MRNKDKEKDFIKKAKEVHGSKYIYTNVNYTGCNDKVCIICKEHGEFLQIPRAHLRGSGCPECGKKESISKRRKPLNEVINEFKHIHNDKYSYEIIDGTVDYNNKTKLPIICSEHGVFYQSICKHLKGQGCPKCSKNHKSTTEEFIIKANKIHNDEYDYTKSEYVNNQTKVCIICKEHGEFWQTPHNHLKGQGCPQCKDIWKKRARISKDEFIQQSNILHHNKYIYTNVVYKRLNIPVEIICSKHGSFYQRPSGHLRGDGCPKCSHQVSLPEKDIIEYIQNISISNIVPNSRKILNSQKELDIYLPDYKFAIEYNGLIWHSEQFKTDKNYHLNKLNECNSQGINLIQIFEDEYLEHKDIVLNKIKHLLKCDDDKPKIQARKCTVREIDKETAKFFLEKNHIQGFVLSTIYIGCYYNNELIGVMTFKEERKGNNRWELNRFATDINYRCIGIGGKLFNYFVKSYKPEYIKSFADRRWTLSAENNLYTKLGFKLGEILKPDYRYVNGLKREHKFGYRKQVLIKKYPDKGLTMKMTEKEMCDKLGFYRIWDCGLFKFEWWK